MSGVIKISRIARITKTVISKQTLGAGASTTLFSKAVLLAVVLIHGDGDIEVQITVKENEKTYTLYGNEQAIELIANEAIEITAVNMDTVETRNTPTIEIAYLEG